MVHKYEKKVIMKKTNILKYSALAVMFLFLYTNVSAKKIPAGNVNGTWTKKSSPYIIKGEINIPDGETLTIEPGVEVIFEGHYKFNVQGRLLAIGTVKDTITFSFLSFCFFYV